MQRVCVTADPAAGQIRFVGLSQSGLLD